MVCMVCMYVDSTESCSILKLVSTLEYSKVATLIQHCLLAHLLHSVVENICGKKKRGFASNFLALLLAPFN
jgi:hypothetical protein